MYINYERPCAFFLERNLNSLKYVNTDKKKLALHNKIKIEILLYNETYLNNKVIHRLQILILRFFCFKIFFIFFIFLIHEIGKIGGDIEK